MASSSMQRYTKELRSMGMFFRRALLILNVSWFRSHTSRAVTSSEAVTERVAPCCRSTLDKLCFCLGAMASMQKINPVKSLACLLVAAASASLSLLLELSFFLRFPLDAVGDGEGQGEGRVSNEPSRSVRLLRSHFTTAGGN